MYLLLTDLETPSMWGGAPTDYKAGTVVTLDTITGWLNAYQCTFILDVDTREIFELGTDGFVLSDSFDVFMGYSSGLAFRLLLTVDSSELPKYLSLEPEGDAEDIIHVLFQARLKGDI
jgi:hypothetical protein